MRFREKPRSTVEFEAVQWSGSNWHEIYAFCDMDNKKVAVSGDTILLETPAGQFAVQKDSWIIKYDDGRLSYRTDAELHEGYDELG